MISIADFELLLKQRMGFDAASIGASVVERAIDNRMALSGAPNRAAYFELASGSEEEWLELIEAVVVPETWFFRDPESFRALTDLAWREWLPAHPAGVLRVLSVPCSTGEEPSSLAIGLLEAGFAPDRFRVEAVDISRRALAQAGTGVYGKNSFRGAELAPSRRYFEPAPAGLRLAEAVQRQITYRRGNVLDPGFLGGEPGYDAVFCRNLLIYFDRQTQDRTVGVLRRLLAPGGWLFVGAAETALLGNHGLESMGLPFAFAFREPRPAPVPLKALAPQAPAPRAPRRPVPPPAQRTSADPKPPPTASAPPPAPDGDGLARARQLADEGRLAEAAQLCEVFLRDHAPAAEAFHLLGLLRDAAGESKAAADCYRKALYLDPNHSEALGHLACLLRKAGDLEGAQKLHQRARRALDRTAPHGRPSAAPTHPTPAPTLAHHG